MTEVETNRTWEIKFATTTSVAFFYLLPAILSVFRAYKTPEKGGRGEIIFDAKTKKKTNMRNMHVSVALLLLASLGPVLPASDCPTKAIYKQPNCLERSQYSEFWRTNSRFTSADGPCFETETEPVKIIEKKFFYGHESLTFFGVCV